MNRNLFFLLLLFYFSTFSHKEAFFFCLQGDSSGCKSEEIFKKNVIADLVSGWREANEGSARVVIKSDRGKSNNLVTHFKVIR